MNGETLVILWPQEVKVLWRNTILTQTLHWSLNYLGKPKKIQPSNKIEMVFDEALKSMGYHKLEKRNWSLYHSELQLFRQ